MKEPNPTQAAAMEGWLIPLASAGGSRKTSGKRVGGKALGLGKLLRDGLLVPAGYVLDARVFTRLCEDELPKNHDLASVMKIADTKLGLDRAARARERLLTVNLPDGLAAAIDTLWAVLAADAPWGLAVRSSATCEDVDETSLAGLATSVLGAKGPAAILQAIREVYASAYLPRALSYLARADVRDAAMAVVLQVMVPAQAAGVLFTAPPPGLEGPTWARHERLVHASWGLGAPVVEGAMPTDAVRFSRAEGAVVAKAIAEKRRALVVGENGVEEAFVRPDFAKEPALSAATVKALSKLAERLEFGGNGPFDVEFAVEAPGGKLGWIDAPSDAPFEGPGGQNANSIQSAGEPQIWLLQARPLTGGGFPDGGDADTVWSRANVGEALPGAATPLTWSVATNFADKGFREAFGALGCHVPKGVRLFGNVHGRFYLNLSAFMKVAAQVPGLSPSALLLGASGGASAEVVATLNRQIEGTKRTRFLLRLPMSAPRVLLQQIKLEKEVSAFEPEAEQERRALFDMDLSLLPDDALATTLRRTMKLLDRTGTLMLRCASASLAAHLALKTALSLTMNRGHGVRLAEDSFADPSFGPRAPGANVERLSQALVGAAQDVDSAGPGILLLRVADDVRRDPAAAKLFQEGEVTALSDIPPGPGRDAIERFLVSFGDRAVREAELCTPRWREDPAPLLAMLTSALRAPPADPERALAQARAVADREMAQLEARLTGPEVAIIRKIVDLCHRFTRLRERMRSWVTRVLGMIRTVALDIDRRLMRLDPTLLSGGVFFCTFEELVAALSSGRADVGSMVRLRRAEHVRDEGRPDPPMTFIGRPPPAALPPAEGVRLYGLPASGGVVEGRACVLPPGAVGLDVVGTGEILVSRTTDVGLTPLFLVAAAVVTELGGPLSHAAIVAREYGVPAVVSVPGATTAIKTGDRLRVDGDRGIVEKLPDRKGSIPPPPPPSVLG
ncbi:MAG: phosphoenolpyruvate synthase [Polyangiaceae bacterium]|nr:phosphoenolpyruvate synthase [Polyangiaceae bacterium]